MKAAAERARRGRAPVLAGVMLPGTGAAVEAARQAAGRARTPSMVGSPYYFGVERAAQERHVEAVLEAVRAAPRVALQHPPVHAPHAGARRHGEPAGPRSRACSASRTRRATSRPSRSCVAVKRERSSFRVLQGNESLAAASLLQGGDGMVPGVANVALGLFVELGRAATRAAAPECAALQQRVTALARIYQQGPWLSALKAACAMLGLGNGRPAPPLAPAVPAARDAIAALLDEAGLGAAAGGYARPVKLEAIIFDMDGVLVDSEPFGFEALRRVMAHYGLGYSEEENAEFLGRTTLESCRILKARHGLPEPAETLATGISRECWRRSAGPIPMPGVPEVLERVRASGIPLALASSAEARVIQANLAALSLAPLFEAVVSGTQVARGKPAPDVFLAAADRLAAAPGRCLVVEDSRNGLLAAKAAGMACAVVPCAHTRHQDFHEADHRLAALPELLTLL